MKIAAQLALQGQRLGRPIDLLNHCAKNTAQYELQPKSRLGLGLGRNLRPKVGFW